MEEDGDEDELVEESEDSDLIEWMKYKYIETFKLRIKIMIQILIKNDQK